MTQSIEHMWLIYSRKNKLAVPIIIFAYQLTTVYWTTFPLRPPRLAFAICGWKWQNDVQEIKYSVCDSVCDSFKLENHGFCEGQEFPVIYIA